MEPIDLTASRAPRSPAEAFADLSQKATALGVSVFDVYGDYGKDPSSSWLRAFEAEVAADLAKEDAVFMPSGVMAQQIALAIHRDSRPALPSRFVCHYSSHLVVHEADAHLRLLGMEALVTPAAPTEAIQQPLSSATVQPLLLGGVGGTPSACSVIIELPHREIGGKCTPWRDVLAIAESCRHAGAALHMDGVYASDSSQSTGQYASHTTWVVLSCRGTALGGCSRVCAPLACRDLRPLRFRVCERVQGAGRAQRSAARGFRSLHSAGARVAAPVWWEPLYAGACFRRWLSSWLGGAPSCFRPLQAPYALSAWAGFRAHRDAFTERRDRLREVVAALSTAFPPSVGTLPRLRFDPPVPEVS